MPLDQNSDFSIVNWIVDPNLHGIEAWEHWSWNLEKSSVPLDQNSDFSIFLCGLYAVSEIILKFPFECLCCGCYCGLYAVTGGGIIWGKLEILISQFRSPSNMQASGSQHASQRQSAIQVI